MTFEQIYDGYPNSLNTAERLLSAGLKIFRDYPEIALGLVELGQEELGKSFTFLATIIFADSPVAEEFLFKNWRSHRVKVHRAFLYELISPLRSVIRDEKGNELDGGSIREKFHYEKEVSFYLNYDEKNKTFLAPQDEVTHMETGNRALTLACLLSTAFCVKKTLDMGEKETNYKIFSDLVQILLCQEIYQQDMPRILEDFAKQSQTHADIIANLHKTLEENTGYMTSLTSGPTPSPP